MVYAVAVMCAVAAAVWVGGGWVGGNRGKPTAAKAKVKRKQRVRKGREDNGDAERRGKRKAALAAGNERVPSLPFPPLPARHD